MTAKPDGIEIRIRGRVQGVGFRPAVWRAATRLGLRGEVLNDGQGVLVRAAGSPLAIDALVRAIRDEPPPLARIERIDLRPYTGVLAEGFHIAQSLSGQPHTEIAPDAALCAACAAEIADPSARRHRYPFANCTHCGPRLSILRGVPYDRATTTMAPFSMCPDCWAEYESPTDRRFHAEAVACPACGPRARLIRLDGVPMGPAVHPTLDDIDAAAGLIQEGAIVAIKGLGGYQLACDATDAVTVARLRRLKRRDAKPFALMARDLAVVARYAALDSAAERVLRSPQAPILLLRATGPDRLPEPVAPGLATLGFMLPTTPLHQLLLQRVARPVVMTSGNLSDEPQAIDDAEASTRLASIASHALVHDRPIANRVDDSVVRIMAGRPRALRRARGMAPEPTALPEGFAAAPDLLALGGELKATFCLIKDGAAILSQHQGDLENAATLDDYRHNLSLYTHLFAHEPAAIAIDRHPDYLSAKLGRQQSRLAGRPLVEVQHHHAHIAACMAENGHPLTAPPALGIVLDGLGWGEDGTIWGGELLLADYAGFRRLATFKPVAMPGGAQAAREPWRNLYAHLTAETGWPELAESLEGLEIQRFLAAKPLATLDSDDHGRHQFAQSLVLRQALRRRRRRSRPLPRAPGL